jgi:hypothetical protein
MQNNYDTSANQSSLSGPRLLVPVSLQALVVNGSYMQDAEWSIAPNNYKNLSNFQLPVEPPPFTLQRLFQPNTPGDPWTGVILHWTLPNALTHGTQASTNSPPSLNSSPANDGDIQYPIIPNRWLVLRTSPNPDPENLCGRQARCTAAWVIQSDLLNRDNNPATQQFHEFLDPATGNPATIGSSSTLAEWLPQWQTGGDSYPLQAVGPGNSSYVAYTANLFNVISFQDTLSDLPTSFSSPLGYLPLTYMVFGWYSDPTADPLAEATADNWQNLMTSLQWSVDNGSVYPSQILCHAMVYDVKWYGPDGPTQSGVPGAESPLAELPLVAVGNTAVEALAALIEQQICAGEDSPYCPDGENVAELMEAFQYNLIQLWDQPGGQAQIDKQAYQARFGSTQGGTIWQVVRPTSINQSSPPNHGSPPSPNHGALPPPPLTPEEAALLLQLNHLQSELDRQQRLLDSMQWELYALWWKYMYCQSNNCPEPLSVFPALVKQLQQAVESTQQEITNLVNGVSGSGGIESTQAELTVLLGDSLQLVSASNQRFWQPADPVVLVGGAKGSFKHRPDGRLSDDGTLPCRITGQTISTITVTAGKHPSQSTVASTALNPELPTGESAIPTELADLFNNITALYGEALLLDTDEAMPIAELAVQTLNPPDSSITAAILAPIIYAQQTALWNSAVHPSINAGATADASGFNGTPPYLISVMPWSPPWSPLYMDWSVRWIPSYAWLGNTSPNNPAVALDGWSFDEMDYDWNSNVQPDPSNGYFIQGRTMLTPQVTDTFAARLEQYLHLICKGTECVPTNSPPDSDFPASYSPPPDVAAALGEALQLISQWDILSQTLTGFHQQLILRDPSQHIPCSSLTDSLQPPVWPLVGTGDHFMPMTAFPGSGMSGFNPIRAGHFIFQKLWIVDDFGQVFDVGEAMNNIAGGPFFPTAVSDSLTAPGNPTMMQLPPRIVQPSRLAFTLVSAEDDAQDTAFLPAANPICGWVLPNHLDASLFIFDTDGNALGEMQLVGGKLNRRARWNPMPDNPAPVGAPPSISNAHLRGFVEGILNKPDGGGSALSSLLDAIDETLWTVDPLGGRSNQSLSVLIGRPLALTRARLMFELAGDPVYDQSWANTGKQVTANFTEVNFTIRLGDLQLANEGLLGYFMGDDYQHFNSVRLPQIGDSPPAYIVQHDFKLQLNSDLSSPPDLGGIASPPGESIAYITMLVDPRGTMHAGTGILPIESLTIPAEYVEPALAQMEVTFRTGPLLTATEQLQMPLPATTQGNWSWVQHPGVTTWQEITTIAKANPSAILSDIPVSIREGWLKLTGALAGDDETK